jgi:hypothetical protein
METEVLSPRHNSTKKAYPVDSWIIPHAPANSPPVPSNHLRDQFIGVLDEDLEGPYDSAIFSVLLQQKGSIRPREEILPGLARGEVGLIVSPTDGGKTTLLRNIAADCVSGRNTGPFGANIAKSRYVSYLDFEDTMAGAIADFQAILGDDLANGQDQLWLSVKPNYIDWDALEGTQWNPLEPLPEAKLSLSNAAHRNSVIERITRGEDRDYVLLIVDTIASGFDISDENDSATIANTVMKPLADIAIRANVAVLAAVHQSTKGSTRAIASHKIRGSTVFGDLARAIYQLTRDEETGEYELRLAKGKGANFKPRRLRLEGRRFSVVDEIEPPPSPYMRVRELLLTGEFSPGQISEKLEIPKRSVERILERGGKLGGFAKTKRGIYTAK